MRLLIVTQVVDTQDPILGFFHQWIIEFAKLVESVEVICLKEGEHSLPSNVQVHSLGKERGKESTLVYALRFLFLVWKLRKQYDNAFVHMNTEYVVLAGWLWRLMGVKIALWYTHGTVSLRLRIATMFAHVVLTASDKSMRLSTHKKQVMGHGMDLNAFPLTDAPRGALRLVSVGRVSRVKNVHILVAVLEQLRLQGVEAHLTVVGMPVTEQDNEYQEEVKKYIVEHKLAQHITFVWLPCEKVQKELANSHLFLHVSSTGSLDKAPLEALASGVPVITTNPEVAKISSHAYVSGVSVKELTDSVARAITNAPWSDVDARAGARKMIETTHSLSSLIARICVAIENI